MVCSDSARFHAGRLAQMNSGFFSSPHQPFQADAHHRMGAQFQVRFPFQHRPVGGQLGFRLPQGVRHRWQRP